MRRRFVTLDVFTSKRFAGNPLAVVLEAEGLDGAAMQAIAREFNLSETVFVLDPAAPTAPPARARVRIFTPGAELPFAGHPTIGTAVLLARIDGGPGERELVLEEGVGPVRCTVEPIDADCGRARFEVPREPEQISDDIEDLTTVAAALSLTLDDLGCENFLAGNWSAGNPFTFIPVRGRDAVARSQPDPTKWDQAFGPDDPPCVFVFCRESAEDHFHARMFAPRLGIPEDPATGSAAAAFAGVITRFARPADGEHEFVIEQGQDMGRPSLLRLFLTIRGAKLVGAAVGGEAVVVTEGTIEA
jgi:trans-2,3-dihydro-3-hydroxyanthranilate isomerase